MSNKESILLEIFDHRLVKDGNEYIYYPDLHKKYEQYTNKDGYELILSLYGKVKIILKNLVEKMKKENLDVPKTVEEGYYIYDNKPSQRSGITWSDEEYEHLGFQYVYIKIKCIQRFTEVYNLLVRMHNKNLFNYLKTEKKKTFKLVSIGGGPGFELYAAQIFFKKYYKNVKVTLTTVDLSTYWADANKVFGVKFIEGSFYDQSVIQKISEEYDMGMMSYVMHHYFDKSRQTWPLFHQYLGGNLKMIMVNTRKNKLQLYEYLKPDYYLYYLIRNNDHRQSVISNIELNEEKRKKQVEVPFFDVPYTN